MTTIRLIDARRGLNRKCEELFGNAKIAEAIYRFLCDGIEECEDAEPEVRHGRWVTMETSYEWVEDFCSVCHHAKGVIMDFPYCPYCGAKMEAKR